MNATIKTAIGPTILLGSGTYFDYLDPENSEITIEDYAAGLAFECRFSGQCVDQRTKKRVYYSVAQHAVIGSYLVPPEYAYDFLMHESGEPVCGDMVSPLKTLLPEYKGIEKRCEAAIMAKFGVTMSNPDLIKEYDLRMWATEREQLMEWDGQPWGGDGFGDPNGGIKPLRITIIPAGPEAAYAMFLARFNELKPSSVAGSNAPTPAPAPNLEGEVARLKADRNLFAGKYRSIIVLMDDTRQKVQEVVDHIQEEGDRTFLGSTNHADWLRDLVEDMDGWSFDAMLPKGDINKMERDPYADCRQLRTALKLAIDHVEHMTAFITPLKAGYSFESLGEDMPGLKAALEPSEGSK